MHSNVKEVISKIYHLLDEEQKIVNGTESEKVIIYKINKLNEAIDFEVNRLQHLLNISFKNYLPNKFLIFKKKIKVQLVSSTIIIILPRDNDVLQSTETYYEKVYRPLLTYLDMLRLDTKI